MFNLKNLKPLGRLRMKMCLQLFDIHYQLLNISCRFNFLNTFGVKFVKLIIFKFLTTSEEFQNEVQLSLDEWFQLYDGVTFDSIEVIGRDGFGVALEDCLIF